MFPWQELISLVAVRTLAVVFDPAFWIILAFVAYQYYSLQRSQKRMFGISSYSLRQQVVMAAFYGTIGGMVGSFLLTVMGITINRLGFNYIWPLAILLMMFSTRFLCFAYAGGLVALSNVIFGWPNVNVPQVLALIAILHVTESLLIAISSRYSAVPMILRRSDGQLVGAFNLQNFWPLPLVVLAAAAVPEGSLPAEAVKMGDWWPVLPLGIELEAGKTWLYGMVPVVAALGYTDMAIASRPAERRLKSARNLAVYSIALLTLAVLSAKYAWLQVFAALLSPIGHELLIQLDNKEETEGRPYFVQPLRGVMILDTIIDTPAQKMGLRPGDVLHELDGRATNSGFELAEAISFAPEKFSVLYERDGMIKEQQGQFIRGERKLGVILVPQGHETVYAELGEEKIPFVDWFRKFGGKK